MSKRQRLRKMAHAQVRAVASPAGLKLGNHQFRSFTNLDVAFGAAISDYPPFDSIPEEFRRGHSSANKVASTLFFRGGKLDDFGLRLKSGVDRASFFGPLQAMLGSFEPKHEHKEAACAWLIAEYTEAA